MTSNDRNRSDEFIPVNQVLNTKPKLGPIPGDQVIAWCAIFVTSYLICEGLLGLGWTATLLIAGWGMATWWALTGNSGWKFLTKFQRVPKWTLGHSLYQSIIESQRKAEKVIQDSKTQPKARSRKPKRGR